jgi:alkyl sulfatase BDS1-like metallo-beta-lactamase superfamily hydrolase
MRFLVLCLAVFAASCNDSVPVSAGADPHGFSAPTPATLAANRVALPEDDGQDHAEASRGLLATDDSLQVEHEGDIIYDRKGYDFVTGEAPASVHPSLWRQATLNNQHGLFEVTPGIWQIRGHDLANLTLIRGDTGWIVVDPLTVRETATRAMALARKQLGDIPVSALIYTHSHIDHFGGALGAVSPEEAASIPVYAPHGFMEEVTSENVLAGPGMLRRSMFMYGRNLPRSERGKIDNGLGKEPPSSGTVTVLPPTHLVDASTRPLTIDGVEFVFQYTPGSEAPAEMTFYLPRWKVFCGAEVLSRTLHNLYTLRGAKVRDAWRWAGYIDEADRLFDDAEIMIFSHHWPVWGRARIQQMLEEQHDTYRFIHDQTLRLANRGFEPRQIAEQLTLPDSLMKHYWNRGYYGTLRHDTKAVYQMYFGWYDGNPAHLDPLPRGEADTRYVKAMGGADAVLALAREAHQQGEDRWAAELLDRVVSSDADNAPARALLADVYDQLGYRSESSAWRNVYLSGAHELRHGAPRQGFDTKMSLALLEQMSPYQFMQMFAVALNGEKAAGKSLRFNVRFTDIQQSVTAQIRNGVLVFHEGQEHPDATATLSITRPLMARLFSGQAGLTDLAGKGGASVEGSLLDLAAFFTLLDRPDFLFPLVTTQH